METTQFKNGSKLIVCIHDKDDSQAPITLENPSVEELRRLNKQGFGIFETANHFFATKDDLEMKGGTKRQKDFLSQLTEVFADIDISKEEDKMPEDKREELKRQFKEEINTYCPATFYVFTKNGLQPHWRIDETSIDEATQDKYKNVIRGIVEWSKRYGSKGDPVYDVTRVLRKPEFFHNKTEPYLITEELGNGKVYTLDELKDFFWKDDAKDVSSLRPIVESNPIYKKIDELDLRQVVIDVWREKGGVASFDQDDRLVINGIATATFKGRLPGNYMATTSSDYPAKGNAVTYVAETLGMSTKEAFGWICSKYGINGKYKDVSGGLPEPITAEELNRKEFSPEIWMIDRLLPENQITIMSGAPSSFKTMNALDWAIRIASGEQVYGKFNTLKSKVLLVSEDGDHMRILQQRMRFLGGSSLDNLYFLSNSGFRIDEDAVDDLIAKVIKYNIKFAILDSLRAMMPTDSNEMDAKEVRRLINRLRPLIAVGVTILMIHHERKRPSSSRGWSSKDINDIGEMMSGSADIRGAADCHLSIRSGEDRKNDQSYVIITQTKGRQEKSLPSFKVLVNTEKDNIGETTKLWFTYDGEYAPDNAEETLIKAKEAILEFISKSADEYVWRQTIIDNKPGKTASRTIDKALKDMEEVDKSIASKTGKDLCRQGLESKRKFYYINKDSSDIG